LLSTIAWFNFAAHQWLQFDIGPPSLVTGVVTRGRGESRRRHWVTRYLVSYSNDTSVWYFYKDATHLDIKVCFCLHLWLLTDNASWRRSAVQSQNTASYCLVTKHSQYSVVARFRCEVTPGQCHARSTATPSSQRKPLERSSFFIPLRIGGRVALGNTRMVTHLSTNRTQWRLTLPPR